MTRPTTEPTPLAPDANTTGNAPPEISIIIPAFNREKTIGRAILSIMDTGLPSELIIVDDGSADGTVAAARQAIETAGIRQAKVLTQANAGPGAARNRGAASASGTWLAFLDSDDCWFPLTPNHLAVALSGSRSPALLFLQTIDSADDTIPKVAGGAPIMKNFKGFAEATATGLPIHFASCNLVMRRDVLESLGGFTADTYCSEDSDLFLRASCHGECMLLTGTPLVFHQVGRGDNLTSNFPRVRAGLHYLIAQDRRGAYPEPPTGPRPKVDFLAKSVAYAIRIGFATGHPWQAYALYFQHIGRLVAGRDWHWLIRLPLTPLLHLLRPANFPFRWRPSRKE